MTFYHCHLPPIRIEVRRRICAGINLRRRRKAGVPQKYGRGVQKKISGQRAILAGRRQPTTFAAEGLSFRVRDGNGRFPLAMATRKSGWRHSTSTRPPCQAPAPARLAGGLARLARLAAGAPPATPLPTRAEFRARRPASAGCERRQYPPTPRGKMGGCTRRARRVGRLPPPPPAASGCEGAPG